MSRALADLLQVHSRIDGPADPRMASIAGREALRQPGRIPRCVPEASPDLGREEFSAVPAPGIGLGQPILAGSLSTLPTTPLALVVSGVRLALCAMAVRRVPGALRPVLVDGAGPGYQRRKILIVSHRNKAGPYVGKHPLREEEVLRPEAVLLDVFLYRDAHLLGDGEPAPVAVLCQGCGLVNHPALPDGWYLALTTTVDRVTFSICCPNSKSHGRNRSSGSGGLTW